MKCSVRFLAEDKSAPFLRPLVSKSSRGEAQPLTKRLELSPKIGD